MKNVIDPTKTASETTAVPRLTFIHIHYVCEATTKTKWFAKRRDGGPCDGAGDDFETDEELGEFLLGFLRRREGRISIVREPHPYFDRLDVEIDAVRDYYGAPLEGTAPAIGSYTARVEAEEKRRASAAERTPIRPELVDLYERAYGLAQRSADFALPADVTGGIGALHEIIGDLAYGPPTPADIAKRAADRAEMLARPNAEIPF